MQNIVLKMLIKKFRNQDMSIFSIIYDEYKRLLYHYSAKLGEDDSLQELTLFLVELLYSIDISRFEEDSSTTLTRYIAVCIRNKFIELSKRNQNYRCTETQLYDNESCYSSTDFKQIEVDEALKALTTKQRLVIVFKYIYGYSDEEIANKLRITRQAVNRVKNRALEELRSYYI